MKPAPKIALISAVPTAIPPAQSALRDHLPDAVVWNILDDRLLVDAADRGGLDDGLRRRMRRLIEHALAEDAEGVLLTCSLYGPVAQESSAGVPVLAPDESAFADIAAGGYAAVLVLASFDRGRDDSVKRLEKALRDAGSSTRVVGRSVPAAMAATETGDRADLLTALVGACGDRPADVEAVFLAQYSLAPVAEALRTAIGIPVISGPGSAAGALHRFLSDGQAR